MKAILIPLHLTLLLLITNLGCIGQKTALREFQDVQAMNSQVLNYRDWIQDHEKEFSGLEKALKPLIAESLRNDFPLHQHLTTGLEQMRESIDYILDKAKKQRKIVMTLRESKKLKPKSKIGKTETTYNEKFVLTDSHVQIAQAKYGRNREALYDALKRKNQKLVFIDDQITEWKPDILKLQEKRKELIPRIEKMTRSTTVELTFQSWGETVELMAEKINRVEELDRELEEMDGFFKTLEARARQEAGGPVYVMGKGGKPLKYERRCKDNLVVYKNNLDALDILLPD